MKQEQIKKIQEEISSNWKEKNNYLGVKRFRLESFSNEKNWKVRKVIAYLRRNKIIILNRRYYFFNLEKLSDKTSTSATPTLAKPKEFNINYVQ